MPDLGEAVKAELDRIAISKDTTGELKTPRTQLAYILRKLGPQNTAKRLGTTLRAIKGWLGGTVKPRPDTAGGIQGLYRRIRRYDQVIRGRSKIRPAAIRAQISGTITFSFPEYRHLFGGTLLLAAADMAPVIAAWKAGRTAAAGAAIETALQNASGVPNAKFLDDDYELDLFG